MGHIATQGSLNVRFPVPKDWDPETAERVEDLTLDQARFTYRATKDMRAFERWEQLALELAEAAQGFGEVIHAHFEAPEGGPAYFLSLTKWEDLSLAVIEAAEGRDNLKRLLKPPGTRIAPKAKKRLIEKLQPFCLRR